MYQKRLSELKIEKKTLTHNDIGKVLGIDGTTYSHYEKEDDLIPLKHLITVCDMFNVSLDYIFEFTNKKKYSNSIKGFDLEKSSLRLKELRKNNNMSQELLARRMNNNRSSISAYESKRYLISTDLLYDICKKYKVSADYLVGKID